MSTVQYGTKFGVVDFEAILKQSTKVQKLVNQWHTSAEFATLRDNIVQAEQKIKDFKIDYRTMRKDEVYKQQTDLQKKLQLQTDLLNEAEHQHITLPLVNVRNDIQVLVKKVATENGLNLVLNSTSDVFFIDDAADITNDILALYDAM